MGAKEKMVSRAPGIGGFGKSYMTHGPEFTFGDFSELAGEAKVSPDEARDQMIELIRNIPDEDLQNFVAAQVTVVG
ncbi:MAG: hypothetical protein ABJO09_09495 [Hyphomicrobiales bacterium]|uniref:hypothetical protein n=1 Tax=Roseibium sp. TaxID=1936156 RepID=UPI0032645BDE